MRGRYAPIGQRGKTRRLDVAREALHAVAYTDPRNTHALEAAARAFVRAEVAAHEAGIRASERRATVCQRECERGEAVDGD